MKGKESARIVKLSAQFLTCSLYSCNVRISSAEIMHGVTTRAEFQLQFHHVALMSGPLIPLSRPCRSSSCWSLASHRGGPGSRPDRMCGSWWTKRHWDRFSPNTSVSLANHHSTNFSIIIIARGWHDGPIGGRSAEWTQLDSTPHYTNFNFKLCHPPVINSPAS
jgi:hypothetical protein